MYQDFPVEFRNDDLVSSYESLIHYRTAYELIDDNDPPSDFDIAYIMKTIEFYETRISQIRADLDWFKFIDAETTPVDDSWQASLIATPQSKLEFLLKVARTYRMYNVSPYSFGKAGTDYSNKKADEFEWLAFMEAN